MILHEPRIAEDHTCPACGMEGIEPYSTVDAPPIWRQMMDNRLQGYERIWLSERHHCPKCNEIFDVIVISKLLRLSETDAP